MDGWYLCRATPQYIDLAPSLGGAKVRLQDSSRVAAHTQDSKRVCAHSENGLTALYVFQGKIVCHSMLEIAKMTFQDPMTNNAAHVTLKVMAIMEAE